jgi:hypothetical protein
MHAKYRPDGSIEHVPAAVDDQGRAIPVGFDPIEDVTKVATLVWNPLSLDWERAVAGEGGGSGATVVQTVRVDTVSATLMYVGEADPGTAESSTGWVVKRIISDANGNVTSVMIGTGTWTGRAGLGYL